MRAINVLAASGAMVVATCAVAQVWCPASGWPGVPAEVGAATVWDADGAGPIAPTFVVALKRNPANGSSLLYRWNGGDWIAMDAAADRTSLPSEMTCMTAMPNGDLILNGFFVWNGTTWTRSAPTSPLPVPDSLTARRSALHPDGRLIVLDTYGQIWTRLGTTWNYIAVDTSTRGAAGLMTITPNGDIWLANGLSEFVYDDWIYYVKNYAARWDGQQWTWILLSIDNDTWQMNSMVAGPDGSVYVSGRLANEGTNVFRIGGGPLGESTFDRQATQVIFTRSGELFGTYVPRITPAIESSYVFGKWNGTNWEEIPEPSWTGGSLWPRFVLAADDSSLLVAGRFPAFGVNRFYRHVSIYTFSCENRCDTIDFNGNIIFPEDQDVIDFFNVLSGASCSTCNDIDFNNNGVFPEDADVIDFFHVLAGGVCQ